VRRPDTHEAAGFYERMHWGRRAKRTLLCVGPKGMPETVAELGHLVDLKLVGGQVVAIRSGCVRLVTDTEGEGLYLVSETGLQLDPATPTGRIASIAYRTAKGMDTGRPIYEHAFEGRRPELAIDAEGFPIIRRAGSRFRVTWRGIVG
jgi:hypothetical protein